MEDPAAYANRAILILDKLMDKQFSTDRILAMAQVYATLAVWEELKRANDA